MNIKTLALATTLSLTSAAAIATPQYYGNTFGDVTVGDGGKDGYFLWNDETSPNDWHLRWTATNTDPADNVVEWAGNITFRNSTLSSTSEISFEVGGIYGDLMQVNYDDAFSSGEDDFGWIAATTDTGGVDGIDFTLSGDLELMELGLGSSLFSGLDLYQVDPGVTSTGIFIGSGYDSTNVLVSGGNGMQYQNFEITVPEPASIALLGLGLAGLGFSRRNKKA